MKFKILCFLFLISTVGSFAQVPVYSTTNKAAIRLFEDGTKQYDSKLLERALKLFREAGEKDPQFIEAFMLQGDVLAEMRKYEEAIIPYKKAIEINPGFFPNNFFQLAALEYMTGKYADAKFHYSEYIKFSKNASPELVERAEKNIRNCDFAIKALENPVPFNPVNLGAGVNTSDGEYYPSFTVDQQQLIFTRDVKDANAFGGHQEDFYISIIKDTVWQSAKPVGQPLNSSLNEGAPSISADGRLLFFAACERQGGHGSCDIYIAQRNHDGSWSRPVNIGPPINTSAWESQPSFSSDGKTLYFIRGTYDNQRRMHQDIYVSTFQKDMTWSKPEKLSDIINTSSSEESVFIHPDNSTLYFSSDGHTGMGGLDIFMSRKNEDGSWGSPVNLGYPINTHHDENSLVVSADGKSAYFASDREGGKGSLDLYRFDLYEGARPVLVSYVRARVVDDETNAPLAAGFEIIDVESGKIQVSNTTDKRQGEFLASLPAGKNYMLNVNKEGYLFYSDYFELSKSFTKQQAFELEIRLKKPKAGEKVVLKNIFFDVNKFDLKPESNTELNRLVSFLESNAAVKIEVSGHTDSTGDKKANVTLSMNRAKAVYDYLISKGIPAQRLKYNGYGDTKPVASNDDETGRAQNRRTEFTIL